MKWASVAFHKSFSAYIALKIMELCTCLMGIKASKVAYFITVHGLKSTAVGWKDIMCLNVCCLTSAKILADLQSSCIMPEVNFGFKMELNERL